MSAEVIRIDPRTIDNDAVQRAATILRNGGLVAFPTETVYGLGANALDAAAVARIFAAKGRPAQNPIIVHVTNADEVRRLTTAWPNSATKLAKHFWPGPLTLVLPKAASVPDIVTAGGSTVALRVPAHPVALRLLQTCGLPLAAPSANRSTEISPTTAEHVVRSIGDVIDLVLDAEPTTGGLESTVLDLTSVPPRLLRPGLVTRGQLEALIGPIEVTASTRTDEPARSPGQMQRHYAPRTPTEVSANSRSRVLQLLATAKKVGWLTHLDEAIPPAVFSIRLPADSVSYSAQLYAALHTLDAAGVDRIVVELPPFGDDWLAVHDRLRRAST
jgi:L-threonylcarbamoyladenylate synthase